MQKSKQSRKPPAAAHTPLPWQWANTEDGDAFHIYGSFAESPIAHVEKWDGDGPDEPDALEAISNRDFILRAVNAHDELVGAMRELIRCEELVDGPNGIDIAIIHQAIDKAKAALRKAQGGGV